MAAGDEKMDRASANMGARSLRLLLLRAKAHARAGHDAESEREGEHDRQQRRAVVVGLLILVDRRRRRGLVAAVEHHAVGAGAAIALQAFLDAARSRLAFPAAAIKHHSFRVRAAIPIQLRTRRLKRTFPRALRVGAKEQQTGQQSCGEDDPAHLRASPGTLARVGTLVHKHWCFGSSNGSKQNKRCL
eukprot:CAMPEP_0177193156 /NCGR_PEP_ID=MMETSP0367-20130122/22287_1 /TAXON_ID=447022 ORGANISM="Scrippsiella hangoei-like, Strain SHHI-4" /NCGR_SAMPLE_ID=MMETSP0367 /ASSEMBLY_ACC=CAM_ASM_000362 /LENGTH=187 /DNA_ID=CAMNT_0018641013 /DNA_START=23 /DNA_END=583 /DNA_ORIENTATION=+